jgi:cation/acetate symporter
MSINNPILRSALHLEGDGLWWGIQPISAGVFGVVAGVVATVVFSLAGQKSTPPAAG